MGEINVEGLIVNVVSLVMRRTVTVMV